MFAIWQSPPPMPEESFPCLMLSPSLYPRFSVGRPTVLQKEKTSPQKELGKMMEELYEKAVPADVREYIEGKERKASPPKPKVKPPAKPKTEAHAERADAEN